MDQGNTETKWGLEAILKAGYYLFNNTSARRDDYQTVTGSSDFPLKFAAHRWLENAKVIKRMLEILPNLCKYLKAVKEGKLKNPGTHSFQVLISECFNPLLTVKLKFAYHFATLVEPFLSKYQTDKPALPFLTHDLSQLIKDLLVKFI